MDSVLRNCVDEGALAVLSNLEPRQSYLEGGLPPEK